MTAAATAASTHSAFDRKDQGSRSSGGGHGKGVIKERPSSSALGGVGASSASEASNHSSSCHTNNISLNSQSIACSQPPARLNNYVPS